MLERLLRLVRPRRAPTPGRHQPASGLRGSSPAPWGPASGRVLISYAPNADGHADPGEVVWTAVAFEDDPSQSKDRPVLIIGLRGAWLAGLLLTSKSPGAGPNRVFMDVGSGPWDRQRRPSQVRLDRLLDIDPARVRREGAAFDEALFREVLDAARQFLPELR
jgi:hypothetical protein